MKIKFISVETKDKKTQTQKDYIEIDVTYKNFDFQEKVESKKLNPFGNKDVYNTLKNAKTGDFFEIERSKNDAGYWDWTAIKSVGATENASQTSTVASGSKTTVAPKSTYETSEERAQRQILIVKQSAIAQAVATLSVGAKKLAASDVLPVAQEYYDWVFGRSSNGPIPLADLPVVEDADGEDIPY